DDRSPSMSIKVEEGVWHCHACNIGGGILDFEMKLSNCDRATALANVRGVLGLPVASEQTSGRIVDAVYQYPDALGCDIAEKIRFHHPDGKKDFRWRRSADKGGYVFGI